MKNKKELTKEELISKELRKLKKIFKNLSDDRKLFAEKLMEKAAFMEVALSELKEQVAEEGSIIMATNGNGFKVKMENPALKSYNTTIKNYSTVIKQLVDLLPDGAEEVDELMIHVREKKR